MPFEIIEGDITYVKTDAIVNAANPQLQMGGGVCGAIFRAAGPARLQAACSRLAPIHTGQAVITPGFDLPASWVIHTAGPVDARQSPQESERLLKSAYRSSLELAARHGCRSIAFPLISSGIYGYPRRQALETAIRTIREFLDAQDMDVKLVIFDRRDVEIPPRMLESVDDYIQTTLSVPAQAPSISTSCESSVALQEAPKMLSQSFPADSLESWTRESDFLNKLDEPFHVLLLQLIDEKGMSDVQVYRKANLDRRLFSKIRSGKGYLPGKRTILALAVALDLTLPETRTLLERAGYALSHANLFDVILEYFLLHGPRDIDRINEVLFRYNQPLLGSCS